MSPAMDTAITGMQTVTSVFEDLPAGLYDYILPFLIVFAIVYGMLDKLDLFENDAVEGVLAIAFAFFVTTSTAFGDWMAGFVPSYGLWLIFALAIAIAAQLGGLDVTDDYKGYYLFGGALAVGTAYLIYVQEGWQQVFGTTEIPIIGGVDTFSLVIFLAAAGAVAWVISKS